MLLAVACSSGTTPGTPTSPGQSGTAAGPSTPAVRAIDVPPEHRYVAASDGQSGRILLVDLTSGTSTQVVSVRGPSAKPYFVPPFSESADGRRLLVGASGPSGRSALYLVDVPTGLVKLLYEDEEIWAVGPMRGVISPDGMSYAFHGHDGVRVGETAGGATRLFVEDEDPADIRRIWYPLALSADKTAIILGQGTDTVTKVAVFLASNGAEYWVGTGSQVSLRNKPPYLAVAGAAGSFGGSNRVYVVDPNDGLIRDLEALAAKYFGSIAWHPTADRVLYTVAASPFAEADVYTRVLGENASKRVDSPRKIWEAWWSSDGSRIYATAARGNNAGAPGVGDLDIIELPGARVVASVCRADPRGQCR